MTKINSCDFIIDQVFNYKYASYLSLFENQS